MSGAIKSGGEVGRGYRVQDFDNRTKGPLTGQSASSHRVASNEKATVEDRGQRQRRRRRRRGTHFALLYFCVCSRLTRERALPYTCINNKEIARLDSSSLYLAPLSSTEKDNQEERYAQQQIHRETEKKRHVQRVNSEGLKRKRKEESVDSYLTRKI